MVLARQAWAELVLEAEAELDLYAPDSLPIAMSRSDIDLFVLDQAGHVRWLAGYQADWYETFDDFFAAMVKSSKATARQLRRLGA